MPTGSENQLKSMDDLHTPSADGNSTFHRHEISEHPGKQWELNSGMSVGVRVTSREPAGSGAVASRSKHRTPRAMQKEVGHPWTHGH